MKEYPPCLPGRTIIPALLDVLLIIMFITAVAKDQIITGFYCSRNGTNTALQCLDEPEGRAISQRINRDQSYSSEWPDSTNSRETTSVGRRLIERKMRTSLGKGQKSGRHQHWGGEGEWSPGLEASSWGSSLLPASPPCSSVLRCPPAGSRSATKCSSSKSSY